MNIEVVILEIFLLDYLPFIKNIGTYRPPPYYIRNSIETKHHVLGGFNIWRRFWD